MAATAPTVTLAGGTAMPALGLGTWPFDDRQAAGTVVRAVEVGYRLFDTAYRYGNERGVGRGVRECGLPREQLFVTTKLNGEWHGRDLAAEALRTSLDKLGLDFVDLYLIHWPMPWRDRYVAAWEGLLDLREAGLARAVGTSNFKPAHIDRLVAATGQAPQVNQVQLNPRVTRPATREYDADHGIVTQSWGPLGQGGTLLGEPTIVEMARRYGRTPAQVVLRWQVELGLAMVAKSADPQRLAANLAVFDFELDVADVAALSALDRGEAAAEDSDRSGH